MKLYIYTFFICTAVLLLSACGGGGSSVEDIEITAMEDPAKINEAIKNRRGEIRDLEGEIKLLKARLMEVDSSFQDQGVEVTTTSLSPRTFDHFVEIQGNVMPAQDPAMASSETGGRITDLLVSEDQYVKKGQLIAKVDMESIRKSIAELETSLELAEDMYNRQKALWDKKIGSEVQYLQAKSQVDQLKKSKERLEFELTKANVYAPMSGHVEQVMAKAGEVCGPGTPIIQILNSSALKVVAQVPEVFLGKVKRGDKVTVNFPAIDETQAVRVSEISRTINTANRTFEVEASISSQGGLIKPNLLASVAIKDYEAKDAITVSDELVMQDVKGNDYVMVIEDGKAIKRIVEVGKSFESQTEIKSGLKATDTIIVKGARQVVDGDKVQILEKNSQELAKKDND